jgi:hypothetical protein
VFTFFFSCFRVHVCFCGQKKNPSQKSSSFFSPISKILKPQSLRAIGVSATRGSPSCVTSFRSVPFRSVPFRSVPKNRNQFRYPFPVPLLFFPIIFLSGVQFYSKILHRGSTSCGHVYGTFISGPYLPYTLPPSSPQQLPYTFLHPFYFPFLSFLYPFPDPSPR